MLIAIVIVAALFGMLFGFDQGVISGALPFIKQDFTVSAFMEGVITSAVPLGAVAGTLLAMVTTDRYGRKLRVLARGGESAVKALVAEGLATRWGGGGKRWC